MVVVAKEETGARINVIWSVLQVVVGQMKIEGKMEEEGEMKIEERMGEGGPMKTEGRMEEGGPMKIESKMGEECRTIDLTVTVWSDVCRDVKDRLEGRVAETMGAEIGATVAVPDVEKIRGGVTVSEEDLLMMWRMKSLGRKRERKERGRKERERSRMEKRTTKNPERKIKTRKERTEVLQ